MRIDPCGLRHVAFVEEQVDIGNRYLSIENSGKNEHGGRRPAEQLLFNERHFWQDFRHLIDGGHVVENRHQSRDLIEEILAVAN